MKKAPASRSRRPPTWLLTLLAVVLASIASGADATRGAAITLETDPCATATAPPQSSASDPLACVTLTSSSVATPSPADTELVPATSDARSELAPPLPPPVLPSTNAQGYSFQLTATLAARLDQVTTIAPVYELHRDQLSKQDIATIADRLSIKAPVQDRGNGTFTVDGKGRLFVSRDFIQYSSEATSKRGRLPSDKDAVAVARAWLDGAALLPANIGDGRVVTRTEQTGRAVVLFQPAEPTNLLAAYPSITISVGPGGSILEVTARWADVRKSEVYQLRPVDDAWRQVERGHAYIDADLAQAAIPPGTKIEGAVKYTGIELGYTNAGPANGQQYLEPIFIFSGTLKPKGRTATYPVKAYVPALLLSNAPVGAANNDRA